ncbi:MAG: NAD(P)H-quinone oxidoreductase [Lewinella sp.]|uniref:NAD(P)H-quinone oxidoreductase n=1 Tax=Lewinella sp. TaxID=2004506 RepID=UPI003D6A67FE
MKAILFDQFGGPENLYIGETEAPVPGPDEVLVAVAATALNRADILQREGKYPPPPGESTVLGLEMAGTITSWGKNVSGFQKGDRVCGLLPGGGYAEQAVLPASLALPIPEGLSFTQAAAIPEVFLTAFQALGWLAKLQAGERVLIHAGGSGVGTAAIQLAQLMDAGEIIITASKSKHEFCRSLGAHHTIDYKNEDFSQRVKEITDGKGVDVLIDFVGGPNFVPNLASLGLDSRMVMLAFLGGPKTQEAVNLAAILRKRIHVMGSTLRSRSIAYKAQLTADLQQKYWPAFTQGNLLPIVDSVYPWGQVAAAHQHMEANRNTGKVILEIS